MTKDDLLAQLQGLEARASDDASRAATEEDLTDLRREYLGKKGLIRQVLKGMGGLSNAERPEVGARANETKDAVAKCFDDRLTGLATEALELDLKTRRVDLSLPSERRTWGGAHPIRETLDALQNIFLELGFSVAEGPEAEFDLYNFELLNFPHDHPARDMQDTLVLEGERLLRTHTSPVQIRTMLAYEPPIRIVAPGAVYRRDDDITHSPMFSQVEGLHVDRGLHLGHLKGVLQYFAEAVFGRGTAIRLRPSFFPFTEPSVEVDVACPFCKQSGCRVCSHTGWLEILGAGMVDPNVLDACGVDSETWSGWAFGIGVERVAMLRHGISDIRMLFESDVRFLAQFA